MARKNIRNFCIIAHIDHGKSTLAGPHAGADPDSVDKRDHGRTRCWTTWTSSGSAASPSRPAPSRLHYQADDGETYDVQPDRHARAMWTSTTRSSAVAGRLRGRGPRRGRLARASRRRRWRTPIWRWTTTWRSCRSSTRSTCPAADPERGRQEVEDVIGMPCMDAPRDLRQDWASTSRRCWKAVRGDIPAPSGDPDAPLKALIFDCHLRQLPRASSSTSASWRARCSPAMTIRMMSHRRGVQAGGGRRSWARPSLTPVQRARVPARSATSTASIKTVRDTRVGDTVTLAANTRRPSRCPATARSTPMVFCGIYPADGADYHDLRDALEKLQLNDASPDL